jgi:hypothetical protein
MSRLSSQLALGLMLLTISLSPKLLAQRPSSVDHSTTSFPLTGFHATMQCNQCHTAAENCKGTYRRLAF